MSFKGKSVLVTGGSSGIGASTAMEFAKEGANVAIVGRNETKLSNVAEELQKLGNEVLVIKADVSNENEAKTIVKQTVDKFGKLDVLVNSAGVVRNSNILDENILQVYDEAMNTNMRAIVQITNLAAPHLIASKGNIINISSISGQSVGINYLAYCLSKATLNHFTRCVAVTLGSKGVRCNTVSPGCVRSDFAKNGGLSVTEEYERFLIGRTVLGRMSEAHEIADLVVFLASEKGKGITGANYVSDNGLRHGV